MRSIPLLCLAATLGACAASPQPTMISPAAQLKLDSLVAGRVAGQSLSCVPRQVSNDMSIIDGRSVGFGSGRSTAYLMQLSEGCELLAGGRYAMVTRQYGGSGLCSGDIVQVSDIMNRMTVGSCTIGPIIPYARIRR